MLHGVAGCLVSRAVWPAPDGWPCAEQSHACCQMLRGASGSSSRVTSSSAHFRSHAEPQSLGPRQLPLLLWLAAWHCGAKAGGPVGWHLDLCAPENTMSILSPAFLGPPNVSVPESHPQSPHGPSGSLLCPCLRSSAQEMQFQDSLWPESFWKCAMESQALGPAASLPGPHSTCVHLLACLSGKLLFPIPQPPHLDHPVTDELCSLCLAPTWGLHPPLDVGTQQQRREGAGGTQLGHRIRLHGAAAAGGVLHGPASAYLGLWGHHPSFSMVPQSGAHPLWPSIREASHPLHLHLQRGPCTSVVCWRPTPGLCHKVRLLAFSGLLHSASSPPPKTICVASSSECIPGVLASGSWCCVGMPWPPVSPSRTFTA